MTTDQQWWDDIAALPNLPGPVVTCQAPVNIALIKYWGKRDEELVLPTNDSLSVTLSTIDMRSQTTAVVDKRFTDDKMWLNGKPESLKGKRMVNCIGALRALARRQHGSGADSIANQHVHIWSENNFPTAAGLASSASGFACLVVTLTRL